MLRSIALIASALFLFSTPALAAVRFETDWQKALEKARASKRPIMVDVFATWCGPCKELDAKVFGTTEGEKGLDRFVAVKIDGEKGVGPDLVERYHVVGYPTVLFLDSEGREIDRIFGTMPAADFIRTAQDFASGRATLEEAEKRFAESRSADLELAYELLFRHAVRGNEQKVAVYQGLIDVARTGMTAMRPLAKVDPSNKELSAALSRTATRLNELTAQGRYVTGKYLYLRGKKDHAKAKELFISLQKDFPQSEFAHAANYDLAAAYHGLKDEAHTREALDRYLENSKNRASAASAYAWFCFKHGFQTERGIEVAKQALQTSPKDAGLWDTLAELYGARGEKARALEAIDKALAVQPRDPYFLEQRKKFEALKG